MQFLSESKLIYIRKEIDLLSEENEITLGSKLNCFRIVFSLNKSAYFPRHINNVHRKICRLVFILANLCLLICFGMGRLEDFGS